MKIISRTTLSFSKEKGEIFESGDYLIRFEEDDRIFELESQRTEEIYTCIDDYTPQKAVEMGLQEYRPNKVFVFVAEKKMFPRNMEVVIDIYYDWHSENNSYSRVNCLYYVHVKGLMLKAYYPFVHVLERSFSLEGIGFSVENQNGDTSKHELWSARVETIEDCKGTYVDVELIPIDRPEFRGRD